MRKVKIISSLNERNVEQEVEKLFSTENILSVNYHVTNADAGIVHSCLIVYDEKAEQSAGITPTETAATTGTASPIATIPVQGDAATVIEPPKIIDEAPRAAAEAGEAHEG